MRRLPAALATGLLLAWLPALAQNPAPPIARAEKSEANRLTYLDENDPFYPGLDFPKLTTPQWVGEAGVEAVVILAIDDMRESAPYESYLRPILDRLKQIDGRAPVSIMCNAINPDDPQLGRWLGEGLSLEVHTLHHPCPLLAAGNFAAAAETYHRCVELLHRVPGNRPVAFRMPCCDSMNSPSPRFYAEIFNRVNGLGQFLTIDSSVINIPTPKDPALPRELVLEAGGRERFRKYLPAQTNANVRVSMRSFATTIEDYPYPYVIGRLGWEFPCALPSDWQAQNLHGVNHPATVADWKAALDLVVLKQGVFTMIFHPHGWITSEQIAELIDHAVQKYGPKVKFLNFREAQDRLDRHLLLGHPLRAPDGQDHGVRLLDLNHDGYLDVVIGAPERRLTRVWQPGSGTWRDTGFPTLIAPVWPDGARREAGVRFGVVRADGFVTALVSNGHLAAAWHFNGDRWVEDRSLLAGLQLNGQPVRTADEGRDLGVRFRDVNHDGSCELIVGNATQNALFHWSTDARAWKPLPYGLPAGTSFVDAEGRDNGLRFVDLNDDGFADVLFSNARRYTVSLYVPTLYLGFHAGWTREVLAGPAGDPFAIPMIVRDGELRNNGVWFKNGHLWAQNEQTANLPDVVDRRPFAELVGGLQPPALSPEAALATLRAPPGFAVELVAAEPLVKDPVGLDWGADGRLWVAEMGDYPLGPDGRGTPGGVIRFLEDTDGDGRYDKSTVFLERVNFPTGVMPWRKGVLVSAAPEIFYAEDRDGDGRADVRQKLFTGFVEGNQQHRVNGFVYGLDNWVYAANGDSGGEILSVLTGKKTSISGRDLRFRPEDGALEAVAGQTQFGRPRDDWGNWFGNNNSFWLWHYVLPEHYLRRNPRLAVPTTRRLLANHPDSTRVFPASRLMQRFNDVGMAGHVTSACGTALYRDELFGPAFSRAAFICEPVHNLVRCEILQPDGVSFRSQRWPSGENAEFLASTDNWFRPVFATTGPDGALYIADMYRLVIEHPEWIPPDTQQHFNLRAGEDQGRIYRVYPAGAALRKTPRLDRLDTAGLVAALDSPNGWQRDIAQRLLVERKARRAAASLRRCMVESERPKTRLQALCALEGLQALTPDVVRQALADPHPAVREHAVRVSETILRRAAPSERAPRADPPRKVPRGFRQLAEVLLQLAEDPDPRVRFQLAFSLGEWRDPRAGRALAGLAMNHAESDPIQTAVLSSAAPHVGEMLHALLESGDARPPPANLLEHLLGLAAALKDHQALARGLGAALRLDAARHARLQFAALAGLLDTLDRQNLSLAQFIEVSSNELRQTIQEAEQVFARARVLAADPSTESAERLAAVRLLGRGLTGQEEDFERLGGLLAPQHPAAIQRAALAGLQRGRGGRVAEILLRGWRSHSPALREGVLETLLSRPEWLEKLLAALETDALAARDIGASYRQRLLLHADAAVRDRAGRLFAAAQSDRQAVVAGYESVARLNGRVSRGAELFQQHCAVCHRFAGQGNAVGPDLAALTDRSVPALLVAILDPNRNVEEKYLSYTAVTKSGREVSGIITSETGGSLTLRTATGAEELLLRADLTELSCSRLSLMPEGFEHHLDAQAMADLIAYLTAHTALPKRFAGNRPAVVKAEPNGALRLLATKAEIFGDSLVFEAQHQNLGFWQSENDRAAWTVEVPAQGAYDVWLDWAVLGRGAPNRFRLEGGGAVLEGVIPFTGAWDNYRQARFGRVQLAAGLQRLLVRGVPPLNGAILDLREVRLLPAGSPTPDDFRNVQPLVEGVAQ